jgi:hypothetical protein
MYYFQLGFAAKSLASKDIKEFAPKACPILKTFHFYSCSILEETQVALYKLSQHKHRVEMHHTLFRGKNLDLAAALSFFLFYADPPVQS